jgi:putative membrane protein
MKNLANLALLAIAALTFEACSSTRSTTQRADTTSTSNAGTPATGDASGTSAGNTTGSGTGTMGAGSATTGNTTNGSGNGTTGTNIGTGNTATGKAGASGTANTTSNGTSGTGNTGTGGATSDETAQFIQQAAISGMSEVQLSQLALKNAQSSGVKTFATMMIKDHGGANAELKALASTNDITLPDSSDIADATSDLNTAGSAGTAGSGTGGTNSSTTGSATAGSTGGTTDNTSGGGNMSPAEKMERLRTSSNKEFDQNYVQLMIRDHVKAISLYENGAKSTDPQVKAYALKHLPALRKHLQQVTDLGKTTISKSGAQ